MCHDYRPERHNNSTPTVRIRGEGDGSLDAELGGALDAEVALDLSTSTEKNHVFACGASSGLVSFVRIIVCWYGLISCKNKTTLFIYYWHYICLDWLLIRVNKGAQAHHVKVPWRSVQHPSQRRRPGPCRRPPSSQKTKQKTQVHGTTQPP